MAVPVVLRLVALMVQVVGAPVAIPEQVVLAKVVAPLVQARVEVAVVEPLIQLVAVAVAEWVYLVKDLMGQLEHTVQLLEVGVVALVEVVVALGQRRQQPITVGQVVVMEAEVAVE
jgi:hypothetical protein